MPKDIDNPIHRQTESFGYPSG